MLYNKNNVRKTNDKKILHKVGKQWKVVSVALLMAIGGGAAVAATNNNANAQSTNGASVSVQSEAADLENDNYKAPQSASASSQAPSSSAKAPSLVNVNYAPSARVYGNNASAASYNNHADFDQARINYYGPTVKRYVNSINAKYPEANSLANNVTSAKNEANNDNSLASSYAATAKDPATSSVVSGLALKAGLTTSAYIDSVQASQSTYANDVSNGSNAMSAMSYATSLASAILNGNPSLSSANALVAYENASAEYENAYDNSSADANIVAAVESAMNDNQLTLNDAQETSFNASENAHVAQIYSGIDSATVYSAAKVASFGNSNTNSFANSASVSSSISAIAKSANNSLATQYSANMSNALTHIRPNTNSSVVASETMATESAVESADSVNASLYFNNANNFSLSVGKYNFANDANKSAMMRVISDTAALSAQASVSASATSTIASANAYKAAHANDLSSADALESNGSANVSAAKQAVVSAEVNNMIASTVNSGVNKLGKVAFANEALELAAGGNAENYAKGLLLNNPDFQAKVNSAKADVKSAVSNTSNVNELKASFAASYASNYAKNHNGNKPVSPEALVTESHAASNYVSHLKAEIQNDLSSNKLNDLENIPVIGVIVSSKINALKDNVKADLTNEGINVTTLKNDNVQGFAQNVQSYEASLATESANPVAAGTSANLSDAVSLAESNAANSYNSVVSASNSYSDVTDQDVTLASYFASSYTSEANSASTVAASDTSALNSYYVATANNADFTNAFTNYNIANGEIANEKTLAHAFGVNVLHHSPQFLTLLKNAVLHTGVGFTKKNSVKAVKAGEQFAVKGVGFDEAGNIRYVVGTDDGQPVYLTGNDSYVENSYLEPDGAATVKFNKAANAHKGLNFNSKVVGSVKAGQTVTGNIVATLSNNSYNHYFGVARLQLSDGSFVTANKNYFTVVPTNNNASNQDNSESNKNNNSYVHDLVLFN